MAISSSSSDCNGNKSDCCATVVLNVYDLTPLNNYTHWIGFGIFHSGIEVYGREFGFGAHELSSSGVFEVEPRKCPGFIYRRSITLGQINMHPSEFQTFIENMASEYYGDTYHLISKNCNHFTDDLSRRLTGKRIPGWVNRLANLGALCSCLLPESLQVSNVKQQMPEWHVNMDDSDQETDDDQEINGNEEEKHLLSQLPGYEDVSYVKEVQAK
ncbi:hypothetical protein QN277_006961 [Acacia crassicarpa]|uniref:PPPDE domain-containing protein n=1 Tax=Acacia crassicarpa TaxID=499986 RepID=A0AAE1M9D5_9FABA|nr:hypothetical protein QN277_006961 [Acacia crassicarpa]